MANVHPNERIEVTPPRGVRVRLTTVDSHTCGQETRVVVDGLPSLDGMSVSEARDHLRAEHDWVRSVCALEPRGHRSMFVAALVPASDPECAFGVVFMDADAYPNMCGHATIGVATTLVELGLVDVDVGADQVAFALEAPAGAIPVRVELEEGRVRAVAFRNQPAFYLETVPVPASDRPEADVAVAWGGQWYAFVEADAFGLEVEPERLEELIARADEVRVPLAERLTRPDPRTGGMPDVGNIVWCAEPTGAEADARNVPVSRFGAFDRSPCGTATCARLAVLHAQGALAAGETFVNQGILGTVYHGRILDEAEVAGVPAVVPEVKGSAWLTGRLEIWVDPADPLREGFLVGTRSG